ncbi:unnamed protein product [Allacma fusca]|uniref:BPTI/Kunitz inhibitor domain-containing protein n=1 Tax=Allacma fusca TaxID=39272 RepID=A0A8J2L0V1_9HEXA|nr:unnamed protein product [Allacma fusca]
MQPKIFYVMALLCTSSFAAFEDSHEPQKGDCFLPKKVGPCRALIPAFYFDKSLGACKFFSYGGCQGNANNFDTREDCEELCVEGQEPPLNRI